MSEGNKLSLGRLDRLIKRVFDIVFSLVFLIAALPTFLYCALAIKLEDQGPVFIRQKRIGFDGKTFEYLKFRTMTLQASYTEIVKVKFINDFRITKIGRFMRKTSIDELPSLINVLKGEMSIIGPRALLAAHCVDFHKDFGLTLDVKPGITGWSQLRVWRGESSGFERMKEVAKDDVYYVEHWSLLFDLKILFLTIKNALFNVNAY